MSLSVLLVIAQLPGKAVLTTLMLVDIVDDGQTVMFCLVSDHFIE